jgi:hypothetical protein
MAIMYSYTFAVCRYSQSINKTGLNALLFRPAPYDFQREHTCHLTTLMSVSVKINFVKTLRGY